MTLDMAQTWTGWERERNAGEETAHGQEKQKVILKSLLLGHPQDSPIRPLGRAAPQGRCRAHPPMRDCCVQKRGVLRACYVGKAPLLLCGGWAGVGAQPGSPTAAEHPALVGGRKPVGLTFHCPGQSQGLHFFLVPSPACGLVQRPCPGCYLF